MATIDEGCPNGRYVSRVIEVCQEDVEHTFVSMECMGHNIACSIGSECTSKLRILRAASTHYPILRTFMRKVYEAHLYIPH